MLKYRTKVAGIVSATLFFLTFTWASTVSAAPIESAAFDTYTNIDCYYFGTGDEGVAFNGVGLDYGSGNYKIDVYFYVSGPFALGTSSFTEHRELYTGSGSWSSPTIYKITGSNSGGWSIEMKVYNQFGLLATAYDDTGC
ncbi:hypothetical protein [Umezawaea sp. Da 62-37]|uniref:hypothetical protein n=1 Tax=Umezawaea sp. Da 62-37 TaxID=3075927 RepID=UPI0028F72F9A|nr:hypothetical protein [Umezawaea sp. Da 62-37]WNV83964.1 hypothetical protein RM788_38245 [Umezawaea sp. Da 62-37]